MTSSAAAEADAMVRIAGILDSLSEPARGRVLTWLDEAYGSGGTFPLQRRHTVLPMGADERSPRGRPYSKTRIQVMQALRDYGPTTRLRVAQVLGREPSKMTFKRLKDAGEAQTLARGLYQLTEEGQRKLAALGG